MPQTPKRTFTLTLNSKPNEIVKVERFLERLNRQLHIGEEKFNKLLIATTEAVNNGIIHGNRRDPEKKVTVTCEAEEGTLTVSVRDEGPGVDPATLPNPLAEENLLRENGRGVFLMQSLMESVEFERIPGGSKVIMRLTMEDNG